MLPTLNQLKQDIRRNFGLHGGGIVRDEELTYYINEGIKIVEKDVHKFSREDDYFVKSAPLPVKEGDPVVNLPEDIYGVKIRSILFRDSEYYYPVKRFRGKHPYAMFQNADKINNRWLVHDNESYGYIMVNQETGGIPQIRLSPYPKFTTDMDAEKPQAVIWYIRRANYLENEQDVCDILESETFLIKYGEYRAHVKERSNYEQRSEVDMNRAHDHLIKSLSDMVPDGDNTFIPNMNLYGDQV